MKYLNIGKSPLFPAPRRFRRQVRTSYSVLLILALLSLYSVLSNLIFASYNTALIASGAVGAGDAKFAAAAAPFIALGDLRILLALFAANLLAAFTTHRIVKYTPLRRVAPNWQSWNMGWKFPMGLSLGGTLGLYLILATQYGAN